MRPLPPLLLLLAGLPARGEPAAGAVAERRALEIAAHRLREQALELAGLAEAVRADGRIHGLERLLLAADELDDRLEALELAAARCGAGVEGAGGSPAEP